MATRFEILERFKEREVAMPTFEDFTTQPAGGIPVETLLSPSWSPYCFNDGIVTFTKVESDLAAAPFVYLTQFRDASEVAQVGATELIDATRGQSMPNMAMIYSTGRCGTTLANHVLNGSDEIWCLSEPDVLDNVANWNAPERSDLLCALAKTLYASRTSTTAQTLGVKTRSQSLFCAAAFEEAYPDARNIFMYRDAMGWSASMYTFLCKLGFEAPFNDELVEMMWIAMFRQSAEELRKDPTMVGNAIDPGRVLAHGWLTQIEAYENLRNTGMKFHPIRYNEFNLDRLAGVRDLMSACGLSDDAAETALKAFDTDSQAGTFMGKGPAVERLTEAHKAAARDVLSRHPVFSDENVLLT